MGIFHLRPLAASCVLLILSVAVAFALPVTALLVCLFVCGAALIGAVAFTAVKGMRYPRLLIILLLLGVLLGMGRVYGRQYRNNDLVSERINTTVTAEIEIKRICSRTAYGSTFLVKVKALEGERIGLYAVLSAEGVSPYYIGDRLQGSFQCLPLEDCAHYSGQEKAYMADGAVMALTFTEKPALIVDGTHSPGAKLTDLQNALHHRMTDAVSGEAGELISALLFGTRDHLQQSTVRNFRRLGLSHLLAISGLHLGMLVLLADRLLLILHVGKRWRIPAVMLFCVGYLFLTGLSFSMLRAVLMLSVLYLSFYAKGDYDPLTSLSLVGALILLWQPYAVLDLSFQMTVLATFGILAFGGLQGRWNSALSGHSGILKFGLRQIRRITASLFVTFSATLALLPIQWLVFGEISLITPISNLIMVPLCLPVLISGLVITALPASTAAVSLLGRVAALLPNLMLRIADSMALTDCVLSLRWDFVPFVLLPAIAFTLLLLAVRLKRFRSLVWAPALFAVLAFSICLPIAIHQGRGQLEAVYRNTGRNEGLILAQSGDVVICDLSGGSKTQLYANYRLAESLGATEIDVLMLTHYHSKQITAFSAFADGVLVRALWLPPPTDEEEAAIMRELIRIAESKRIFVTSYAYNESLSVLEGGKLILSPPLLEKRSVEPAFMLNVDFGNSTLSYMSAAYTEYARHAKILRPLPPSDALILGGHGPIPHEEILPIWKDIPGQILLANEDVLRLFEPVDGTLYLPFPEQKRFLLS